MDRVDVPFECATYSHGRAVVCTLSLRCAQTRTLPACVEGPFEGAITVTDANVDDLGRHEGGLTVADFKSELYFDRLRWKQMAKPPVRLRLPLPVRAADGAFARTKFSSFQVIVSRNHYGRSI